MGNEPNVNRHIKREASPLASESGSTSGEPLEVRDRPPYQRTGPRSCQWRSHKTGDRGPFHKGLLPFAFESEGTKQGLFRFTPGEPFAYEVESYS